VQWYAAVLVRLAGAVGPHKGKNPKPIRSHSVCLGTMVEEPNFEVEVPTTAGMKEGSASGFTQLSVRAGAGAAAKGSVPKARRPRGQGLQDQGPRRRQQLSAGGDLGDVLGDGPDPSGALVLSSEGNEVLCFAYNGPSAPLPYANDGPVATADGNAPQLPTWAL